MAEAEVAESTKSPSPGDGLLRLAGALASNNQHKEHSDIVEWLDTASVEDLGLAFPVLLNWCRNSAKKQKAAAQKKDENSDTPVLPPQTVAAEEVVQKIASVLEEAIDFDSEDTVEGVSVENAEDQQQVQRRTHSISSLRMSLAGYLHTNHDKLRSIPAVADLEKRTKAKVALDRAATNTLNMVNLSAPDSRSVSQYLTPEDEEQSKGWGIPKMHIDLGLGLRQTSPADVCEEYIRDRKPLLHPFTGEAVGRMRVKKVIPSKRRPVWIEYFSPAGRALKPDALAKQGDDLRNDASASCASKLCEAIWAKAPIQWTLGSPPTVCAYDVLVTAADGGYLEMVPGKNFLEFSDENGGWDAVNVRKLAPSLVGSYVVNFMLGVRDRHEDNMMVVGDLQVDPRMMQIDFGYVLMEFPGGVHFDMPRLTMPVPLVDRFNSEPGTANATLMEDLQQDMLAAYLVLRRHSERLVPFCAHLMSSSYDYEHVESVLKGRHVFRTHKSEQAVVQWMSQKLLKQWAHFYFRREIKLELVRGYYKFVELTSFEKSSSNDKDSGTEKRVSLRQKIKGFFRPKTEDEQEMPRSGSFDGSQDDEEEAAEVSPCEDSTDCANLSRLNRRVSDAMKLQKEVCMAMISQNEKHGTLEFDHDGAEEPK